jgi:hypothetical protein
VTIEVLTRKGWRPVRRGSVPPQIEETDNVELRGAPDEVIWVGSARVALDGAGRAGFRLTDDPSMNGHLGLIAVSNSDGLVLGEIEVLPGKVSQRAYELLRADLVRVWGDLIFDPTGVSALTARPPSAAELYARIERPLRQVLEQPAERLTIATGVRRLDRVRSAREMRPAVVLAGMRGAPAMTRVLERSTETPERQLVATTLHLLRQHARRDPDGAWTGRRVEQLLSGPLKGACAHPVRSLTWGMRTDPRYRQILAVYRMLNRPYLHATEGPGELRLGIRGMIRLYEYWVYLQVLLAARSLYGPPLGSGFDVLAVEQRGRSRRLELSAGTTVSFPGDVHIAFEPEIRSNGSGWMNIEYVPHPDQRRSQFKATPDVAVLRGGLDPRLIIIDAKYVGRHHVEAKSAELHEKYARMRFQGRPVVDFVYAAHPHLGFGFEWAGYGHFGLAPGGTASIPLPRLPVVGDSAAPNVTHPELVTDSRESVAIVVDQFWLLRQSERRTFSLSLLRAVVAAGRPVTKAIIVMPNAGSLQALAIEARRDGWQVYWTPVGDRSAQIDEFVDLVRSQIDEGRVVVVSGDGLLLERLPGRSLEVCSDVSRALSQPITVPKGIESAQLPDVVRSIVVELRSPATLESIAWAVRAQLGGEVANGWGGHGKFKALLSAACPGVEITQDGPGYVIPPGPSLVKQWTMTEPQVTDGSASVATIRNIDSDLPRVSGRAMQDVMTGVALALDDGLWTLLSVGKGDRPVDSGDISRMAHHVQETMASLDSQIDHRDVAYFLNRLSELDLLRPGVQLSDVQTAISDLFVRRALAAGHEGVDRAEIREWLAGL